MSDQHRRSEEEREAARLERERKRAAERGGATPPPPSRSDLPAQTTPIGAGPPRAATPPAELTQAAEQPPTPPAELTQAAEQPPTPPAELTQAGADKPKPPGEPTTVEAPSAAAESARPQTQAPKPGGSAPAPPRKVTDADERPIGTVRPSGAAPQPQQARRRSPGRHALLFAVVAVVVIALLFVANGIFEPFRGEGSGSVVVQVPIGANAGDVGGLLANNGVVSSAFFFELRATLGGDRANLRAGTYKLTKEMSNGDALAVLTNVAKTAAVINVLVPEGPARHEIAPIVRKQGVIGNYLSASVSSAELNPRKYGAPKGVKSLEGFLFPATYELLKSSPGAKKLVNDQLIAFKRNFTKVNLKYAKSKKLTAFDVITLASIIEREALFDRDRPAVAAVFYNRLRKSISLGSDATTRFAVSNWSKPLTVSQLNSSSKYNTRRFAGMPPGPIGNPGLASLKAAANPPTSSNLFFIVAPCLKGRLTFAKTQAQFQTMIDAYNARRASQGGKDPAFCR